MKSTGRAWKYGPNVDTDVIIPARHLLTGDPKELAKHCMEDLDPTFADNVREGDVIVAGSNFGCGSSREHAPLAILGAGVSCVIAPNYARIFYRNAINLGLPLLESEEAVARIDDGDRLEVDLSSGAITNLTKGEAYQATPYPEWALDMIRAGGLINAIRDRVAAQKAAAAEAPSAGTRG